MVERRKEGGKLMHRVVTNIILSNNVPEEKWNLMYMVLNNIES